MGTVDGELTCEIDVQQAFDCVRYDAPPVKPALTFNVKPDVAQKVIGSLSDIQGRTDDSEITKRQTKSGGMQYALVDKRNGQPLATLQEQPGGQYTMALYKNPDALAERIDSFFISAKDIRDFIQESCAPGNTRLAWKPGQG